MQECFYVDKTVFIREEVTFMGMKLGEKKRNYFVALAITVAAVLIFNNSLLWPEEGFVKHKILLGGAMLAGVVAIPILVVKISFLNRLCSLGVAYFFKIVHYLRENWRKLLKYILILAVTAVIAFALEYAVGAAGQTEFNRNHFYLILTVLYLALAVVFFRKSAGERPERFFLVVILLIGTMFVKVSPPILGISWDDETHYARVVNLANFLNGVTRESDNKLRRELEPNVYGHLYYDRDSQKAYVEELNRLYEEGQYGPGSYGFSGIWSVAYVHSAIGIILGRGLGLSYVHIFQLGKFFNLLLYALLFYFAIKRVRYGKVLIGCIGLIPTTVFMAGSYSYDGWVIGLTVLGYAYFLEALQNPDRVLAGKDIWIMTGSVFLGCLAKAIYFPLLFPFLFMPKEKFADSKQRKKFYRLVIVAMILLVASFILPMVISGPGTGDIRGGSDVNSTEQIGFILGNPIAYAQILFNFLRDYLAIENSVGYLQFYAYMGNGAYFGICIVTLFVLAFVDKGEQTVKVVKIRCATALSLLAIVVLVPTALYISYTAVASETIAGCQYRYLTPILLPALYFLGKDGVATKWNKNTFVMVPMLIMAATFLYNINALCIALY